ncbi:hypothetical protein G7Y89_g12757 [Cudoniella acicularis]|uniref:Uncharacterized protein n=1 Tax=Cudoniella acicularis TaxID=354080 RepID=A0A8H4R8L1_9HELO|nr:hypothetical protein G7Y89_g12757 [Cudoniella acicularis]
MILQRRDDGIRAILLDADTREVIVLAQRAHDDLRPSESVLDYLDVGERALEDADVRLSVDVREEADELGFGAHVYLQLQRVRLCLRGELANDNPAGLACGSEDGDGAGVGGGCH